MTDFFLINLTGLWLALTIVGHLWLVVTIYRQRIPSVFTPLYTYLNILMAIINTCNLFYLRSPLDNLSFIVFKIQFVTLAFIPPLILYLTENYIKGQNLPGFSFKNVILFMFSLILGILALSNDMIQSGVTLDGFVLPVLGGSFWIYIIYFYLAIFLLLGDFLKQYQQEKRRSEVIKLKFLLKYIVPLTLLSFSGVTFLLMWGIYHVTILLGYVVLSGLLLILAFKFEIVEIDQIVSNSVFFFGISGIYLILIAALIPQPNVTIYLLSIPSLLILLLLHHMLQNITQKTIKSFDLESEYDLEDELEILISESEKYIDGQALSQFIADLSLKVLRCTKCAVITSRFDVRPYQISYLAGFNRAEIEDLLSRTRSPFLETLEFNRAIINKFELSPQSALYRMMERYNMYLGIPFVSKNNILGFLLLGGERKFMRLTKKDLRFAKFLSMKAAHALKNIEEIQKAVQSQAMADLGTVASQLAHDFQSFITLVKLETSADQKMRHHADHMEKLVSDLLNYAKPKELRLRSVNINELIDMTLDLLKIPSGLIIEKHYSESIPKINVDTDQMRRVFLNLFENAVNAIDRSSGRIKVTTRPLRPLSNFRRNTWLYIEILDDGSGIPEEFLDKVFDPFFTTRKKDGGSGMGLAIVNQVITRHKGFIDVTSKLGKGTIFNIRLPYLR